MGRELQEHREGLRTGGIPHGRELHDGNTLREGGKVLAEEVVPLVGGCSRSLCRFPRGTATRRIASVELDNEGLVGQKGCGGVCTSPWAVLYKLFMISQQECLPSRMDLFVATQQEVLLTCSVNNSLKIFSKFLFVALRNLWDVRVDTHTI